MATTFVTKCVKLVDPILIRHGVVPKRIAKSQLQFQKIKW